MCLVMAVRQDKAIAKLPTITTVNGKLLCTTAILQHIVRICNNASVKLCHAINVVVVNNADYNVIVRTA